ncbi:GreA/GreB family elongation factor [Fulvivirga maritima]|uniref:GreA/GreB family elongation factor n=1 Tax=Fulvivirga maritima TaxID=2904247 RepID=UPI001F31CFFC|nr:GreA/GreB family elongation factor [Fulvivirga maritima]UII28617.1 GreA/GreB family elongation factor [Fulvivirga maritima]
MEQQISLKKKLYDHCVSFVDQRIKNAKDAMESAQAAANDETKSSAGDKYETGREMMQQEMENNAIQLAEAQKLKEIILSINPGRSHTTAQSGSLVITNNGSFYITIGAGKIVMDGKDYFAIAPSSPLGMQLIDKSKGDSFELNTRKFVIEDIL